MTTMSEELAGFEDYCREIGYTLKVGDSGRYLGGYGAELWAGFKAGAAWQRAQGAGVPEGWQLVPIKITPEMVNGAWNEPEAGYANHIEKDWAGALKAAPAHPAEQQEQQPVAWGAFRFGGSRSGKLYSYCETEQQIDSYITDVHRSNDSITLRKAPLYTAPIALTEQQPILMPERKQKGWQCEQGIYPADGWNSALDEVARLNAAPIALTEQPEVQRLREALERATKLLSAAAGYATKMEPMPAKLLNAIDAALAASTGQEV